MMCPDCKYKPEARSVIHVSEDGQAFICPQCKLSTPRAYWDELHQIVNKPPDNVNHPAHYAEHYPFEVKDAIKLILDECCEGMEAYDCYCLGNELKYRLRAGFKNEDKIEEDIKKAMFYNKERRQ